MKKLFLTLVLVLTSGSLLFAQQTKTAKPDSQELHADIHTFLNQYFPNDAVKTYKLNWNGPEISAFDLMLNSGTEVVFNRDGKWIEIDMAMKSEVPNGIAPDPVSIYIKNHHPHVYITEIQKEHTGYEISLSNGVDLNFSETGEYLGIDD